MTAVNDATAQSLQEPDRSIGRAAALAASARAPMLHATLDLVWTASLRALGEGETYASAVLRVEAHWPVGASACESAGESTGASESAIEREIELAATIIASAREALVALPRPLLASIDHRESWTHLRIRHGNEDIVLASFQQGRLVYCTGTLPRHVGLRGGAYDSPTGTLDVCAHPA